MLNQSQETDLRTALAEAADTAAKDENQFVTFMLGDECFGVPMAPVQEIIRVPGVVRVPLAPPNLEGLANLRGCVLPIVNLRRVFGLTEREKDDATRAVVINTGTPLGFVVDRVASVVSVEQRQIESVESIASTVRSDLLTGVVRRGEHEPMIMVLDFDRLIANEFDHAGASRHARREHAALGQPSEAALTQAEARSADELQMVSFTVDAQEYGIAIHSVQEIVQTPEHITEVPNTEPHVLGVMSLRNRLLPLVSLRRLFALEDKPLTEAQRIVVVSAQVDGRQTSVGVVMDAVNEVLRVPRESAEAVPAVLAQTGNMAEIESICRLDGGKRLVSVLCPEKLFHCVSQAIAAGVEDEPGSAEMQSVEDDAKADDEVQLVVFRLANEEYGVPIESVQEIVRIPNLLTSVPRAPAFVEGVINLRGSVLPVVDQRLRFGLEPIGRNDRQRIMVFVIGGARIGFIVDSVAEVLKVAGHHIEPSPRLSEAQGRLVGRVANLEKSNRLIQLVDPEQLLDPAESRSLEQTALR